MCDYKKSHCDGCEYEDKCELAHNVNFCEDCKYYGECGLTSSFSECKKGYEIECNNGFEEKSLFEDDENDDEREI